MFELAKFSQGKQLAGRIENAQLLGVEGGVCVAVCDHWLSKIIDNPFQDVEARLEELRQEFDAIMNHQHKYANLRQLGRESAKVTVGADVGLEYDTENTVLLRMCPAMSNIRERMKLDINCPGDAATWSLRFEQKGGHAIAGFCSMESVGQIHTLVAHIFDPNIGEYRARYADIDEVLQDLLDKFDVYRTTSEVFRTTVGYKGG